MATKKSGIAVDNYKLRGFRKGLNNAGYIIDSEKPFIAGVTVLHVRFEEEELPELTKLIEKLQKKYTKHKNK